MDRRAAPVALGCAVAIGGVYLRRRKPGIEQMLADLSPTSARALSVEFQNERSTP